MRTIGLLGATGYTGRLTATELARRGIDVRLGGRSADRLAPVDATAASSRVTVDVTDPDALNAFVDGLDVVISTVGPFTSLGRPAVEAAVASGVHYVDSTGEPAFMQSLYDDFAGVPAAVVPACGFDYLPGDLAAAVAARALAVPAEEIRVGYAVSNMHPTRGTAMSIVEAVLATETPALSRTRVAGRAAVELPWGENATVPRWAPGATVTCAVTAPALVALGAPLAGHLTGPLLRVGEPVLRRMAARMPEGPSDSVRGTSSARILATASGGQRSATVVVDVTDVYAFTAQALVECALRVDGAGAMAPAQAFEPAGLLDALRGPYLSWTAPSPA